jgi:deoxyribodipyrimidine photo-lyase
MNCKLAPYQAQVYIARVEMIALLERLSQEYHIYHLYSHQETGTRDTYDRDIAVAKYCKAKGIDWQESQTNGVQRGLKNRKHWQRDWRETMSLPVFQPQLASMNAIELSDALYLQLGCHSPTATQLEIQSGMQPGGATYAHQYLQTFLYDRISNYASAISKPEASRRSCSRLSAYLAWGCISMREVVQAASALEGNKRNRSFFLSRLFWHCHFIQKFEMECRIETENLNGGFDTIRVEIDPIKVQAWKEAKTGIPLVDACMRCVCATGYLNFRMRSMLVSFLTHHLFQPWQAGAAHLAQQFLDYEPGIHYPQFQMQAGTMGINTIRIYNPIKQALDHDSEGIFIKKWLPELASVPTTHIHAPWRMTMLEQQFVGVAIGLDYPLPIIDVERAAASARDAIWAVKKSLPVKQQNQKILKKHTHRKMEQENPLRFD